MANKSSKPRIDDYFWATEPVPDWSEWNIRALLSPGEAAALSFGIDPEAFDLVFGFDSKYGLSECETQELLSAYEARIESITRAQHAGLFGTPNPHQGTTQIPSGMVVDWLKRSGVELPGEWQPCGAVSASSLWPWGGYETETLRHLKAAALQWWVPYHDKKTTKAPTQETVADWLVKEFRISTKKASAIAAILHTDDPLPKGPRR